MAAVLLTVFGAALAAAGLLAGRPRLAGAVAVGADLAAAAVFAREVRVALVALGAGALSAAAPPAELYASRMFAGIRPRR